MSCRGIPGDQAATHARAAALASAVRRSRFMVIPSMGRRKPSSGACAALSLTLPDSIRSNARLALPRRSSISLHPPPAGISPTPVSTRPMYVSADACARPACSATSQPPPSAMPNTAATTGREAYLSAMHAAWKRRMAVSSASHWPSCAATSTIRLETPDGGVKRVPLAFLRGHQHRHQIGADAEVLAVVGHHQRLEPAVQLVQSAGYHLHHVLAQRVHFAVELQATHRSD